MEKQCRTGDWHTNFERVKHVSERGDRRMQASGLIPLVL